MSSSNNSNWDRDKYDYEIPTEQNIEQTKKIIEKQIRSQDKREMMKLLQIILRLQQWERL